MGFNDLERGPDGVGGGMHGTGVEDFGIQMTFFAFILGCVPLMLASGSGAASRSTMGTGVVFGVTISTIIGLFLIQVCYVFVQKFSDKKIKQEPETASPDPEIHG